MNSNQKEHHSAAAAAALLPIKILTGKMLRGGYDGCVWEP